MNFASAFFLAEIKRTEETTKTKIEKILKIKNKTFPKLLMAKITKRGRYESKNKKDLNNVLIIQKPPQ
jgi:hypothetical protein